MRVLLLDSSFLPVKVVGWQRAMILFLTGRAEVVESYEGIDIRSTKESFKLPKVLRLFSRNKYSTNVKFSRDNVFFRDNFTCQYCQKKLLRTQLTLDHVIPKSKGGGTSWENVVSCCKPCNNKKGNKMPKDFKLKLIREPTRPNWNPYLHLRLKKSDPQDWGIYLGIELEKLMVG